jgi:exodeoxyribonuclease VII small subunit
MAPIHAFPSLAPAQRLFESPLSRRIVPAVEAKDSKLSFESALEKLETIVESMEAGDVPLAELLAKFEEGSKLLKTCETRLKDAELKIEQLKKQKDGKVAFEKFEPARNE